MKLAVPLLALLIASPAWADVPYSLYAAGKYEDAIKAGVAQNTASGFVIATRAALADELTRDTPCLKCLQRAEGLARRAIAADPRMPEGHIYLAASLGYEARIVGPIVARLHNYPGEAKRELDAALLDDPANPWGRAALGGWNIEIVRTGGETLAKLLYGATVDDGLDAFAAAFKTASNNIALRFQYALSLAGYDRDRFNGEIADSLTRVTHTPPVTAYDSLARARASELLDLLKRGDRRTFDARVRKYQGYP